MDQDAKKRLLRKLPYGLYVLAAKDGNEVGAATVSWLSQVSFEPPLIMVALRVDSHIHGLVEKSGAFAVSLIGDAQKEIASTFFRPTRVEEGSLSGHAYKGAPETGAPVLTEAPGWFEARVSDAVTRGDHTMFVAEVVSAKVNAPEAGVLKLGDTDWSYGG